MTHSSRKTFASMMQPASPAKGYSASTPLVDFYNLVAKEYVTEGRRAIRNFAKFLGRVPVVGDLTRDNVATYLDWFSKSGVTIGTIRRHRQQLEEMAFCAVRCKALASYERVTSIPEPRALHESLPPWNESEVVAILRAAMLQEGRIGNAPACDWWAAFILVLLDARIGVRAASEMSWAVANKLIVSEATAEALDNLKMSGMENGPFDWPFDRNHRDRQVMYRRYKQLLAWARLPSSQKDSFGRLITTGRNLTRDDICRLAKLAGVTDRPPPSITPEIALRFDDGAVTLLEVFEQAYLPLRLAGSSTAVRKQYRWNIERFSDWLGRTATVDDLSDTVVASFIASIMRPEGERPRSAATGNKIRSQLVALWNFAFRKQLCKVGPDVPKLTQAKRVPTSWTVEEVGRILDACDRHPKGVMLRAMVLVLFDTGLRLGALRQAPLSAYRPETRELLIAAETQKQNADQLFVLHPDTCAALERFPKPRKVLIPCEMSEATLFKAFRQVLQDAGLPATRRDMFHKIRRTTATLVEATYGAGTATRILGHSTPGVTAAYLDTTKLPGNDIALRMPRPTKGGDAV